MAYEALGGLGAGLATFAKLFSSLNAEKQAKERQAKLDAQNEEFKSLQMNLMGRDADRADLAEKRQTEAESRLKLREDRDQALQFLQGLEGETEIDPDTAEFLEKAGFKDPYVRKAEMPTAKTNPLVTGAPVQEVGFDKPTVEIASPYVTPAQRIAQANSARQVAALEAKIAGDEANRAQREEQFKEREDRIRDLATMLASQKADAAAHPKPRGVISGDANRISDMNTAMDDMRYLHQALGKAGDTGNFAALGAAAPKWITDLTGFGTDAKKKQALINLVKQTFGKTLEGGVLRLEDEKKYENILPTMTDTTSVLTSKIRTLFDKMQRNRGNLIDSLGDAGYDVTEYRKRGTGDPLPDDPVPEPAPKPARGGGPGPGPKPKGKVKITSIEEIKD